MTKADIVNEISRSTGLDKAAVLQTVKTRKEKTARTISKNTSIIIPEHKVPTFKPSRVFLDEVK